MLMVEELFHSYIRWLVVGRLKGVLCQRLIRRVGQEVVDACSTDLNHKIWNIRRSGKIVYCNVVELFLIEYIVTDQ